MTDDPLGVGRFMERGMAAQKAVDGVLERVSSVGFIPLGNDGERKVLAIDPGTRESAYVGMWGERVMLHGKIDNDLLLTRLGSDTLPDLLTYYDNVVIEMIYMGGMPAGREVFQTCVWIGRFMQKSIASGAKVALVERHDVKTTLCNNQRAKDSHIRQAIIDRYGGMAAIGRKATPGPLYGIKSDRWQALAVGLTWLDAQK